MPNPTKQSIKRYRSTELEVAQVAQNQQLDTELAQIDMNQTLAKRDPFNDALMSDAFNISVINSNLEVSQKYLGKIDKMKSVAGTKGLGMWDESQDYMILGQNHYNPITGKSGTIAHRNNNPGALKMEFAGSYDKTVKSKRSRSSAVAKAKELYEGVITLGRGGHLIFDTVENGKKAQIALQTRAHSNRTIPEMLDKYAIADMSGSAHNDNYAKSIYAYAANKGFNLQNRKISTFSDREKEVMVDAMAKVESGV